MQLLGWSNAERKNLVSIATTINGNHVVVDSSSVSRSLGGKTLARERNLSDWATILLDKIDAEPITYSTSKHCPHFFC